MKLELYDYQKEVVEFMLENPYSIIALEMGMGKSFCFISLKERLPEERFLIICPVYLAANWKREIRKLLGDDIIVSHFKRNKDVYFPLDSDFVIVSFDIAKDNEVLFEWATCLAIDEATNIKSMSAIRTEAIHKYIYENSIKRVYPMTGTPIKNRVQEFYSLISICNYNPRTPDSPFLKRFTNEIDFADYFSFRKEFSKWMYDAKSARMREIRIVKWEGLQKEDELKKWLRNIYISKKSDMPPISYRDIFVDDFDDKELLEEFNNYKKSDSGKTNSTAKAKAALRKAPLTCKYVGDLVDNWDTPIIIFTDHVESCKFMANKFDSPPITGEMSPSQRDSHIVRFQNGEIPVLVGTYGALAHGHTLTASNLIVQNDYPWEPGSLKQADFRINRKGQTRNCHVHRLFGSEQDNYIFHTILQKQEVLDAVFKLQSSSLK